MREEPVCCAMRRLPGEARVLCSSTVVHLHPHVTFPRSASIPLHSTPRLRPREGWTQVASGRPAAGDLSASGSLRPIKPFLKTVLVWRRRRGRGGQKQFLRLMDNVVGVWRRPSMFDGSIVMFSFGSWRVLIFIRTMDSVNISTC